MIAIIKWIHFWTSVTLRTADQCRVWKDVNQQT